MGYEEFLNYPVESMDPLAIAERVGARERYIDNLFQPIEDHFAEHKSVKWTVEGLIPEGYLCLLVAAPKEGKTCLATAIALAVATGTPFAGRRTSQGAVLWIAAEESPAERRHLLNQSPMVDTTLPLYTCWQDLPIDRADSISAIQSWISRTDAKLVVVDPLQAAISKDSLREGFSARRALMPARDLCRHGVSVLVLHHRKQARYGLARSRAAENDQLTATASLVISMSVRELGSLPLGASTASEGEIGQGMGVCEPAEKATDPTITSGSGMDCARMDPDAQPTRLIGLELSGRGPIARQEVWLLSRGPLAYGSLHTAPIQPDDQPEHLSPMELKVLMAIGTSAKASYEIMKALNTGNEASVRNCLTRLRRKGMMVVEKTDGSRRYRLTASGLARFAKNGVETNVDAFDAHPDSGSNSVPTA